MTTLLVDQPDCGVRFWLQIQGIPFVFSDGAILDAPTTWDTTASIPDDASVVPQSAAVLACLDTRPGLVDSGSEITRSTGDVTPSSMKFTLRETEDDELLALFARHRADGLQVNLSGDVPYGDDGSPGYQTLPVDSTSGWTVGDHLYFGRETLIVTTILSGPPRLQCSRNHYTLSGCQSRYVVDAERPTAPRIVSNFPRVWVGRYVRLWAVPTRSDGYAFDENWYGETAREVWRGVLNSDPRPGADWSSYELHCDSIESILRTEIGSESRKGSLLRVPGGLQQNVSGQVEPPPGAPLPQAVYWVDEATNRIDCTVSKWTDASSYANGDVPLDVWSYTGGDAIEIYTGTLPQIVTRAFVRLAFETQFADVIRSDTGIDSLKVSQGKQSGRWSFTAYDATNYYVISINWDAEGSVGRLFGWTGMLDVPSNGYAVIAPTEADIAVFISKNAKRIPFFYEQSIASAATAPSSGYAVIGDDDEVEVVKYSSITTLFNDLEGLYILEGCERGRFGTMPRDHVAPQATSDAGGDKVKVQFGVGWDDGTPFPEVILQLATSTGVEENNGAYDLLPDGIGARLSLAHFDLQAFTRLGERLAAWESRRPMLMVKGMKLSELIGAWMQPVARFITAKTLADGTYRITIGEALPAIESAADTAITTREILLEPAPRYGAAGRIINQIRAFYHWNPSKSEPTDTAYVDVLHDDSIAEYGVRNKLEWKLPGWTTDSATALAAVLDWSADVFRRYGRPFDIVTFDTDRSAMLLSPGDTITLTIPGFPSTRGTRRETTSAVVLQVEKRYSGDDIGCTLRVAIEAPERYGRYVPSARVLTFDGTTGVTLSEDEFSVAGDADYSHFAAGDIVWVYEDEADVTTRVMREISTITGDAVVFTVALSGGFTPGAATLVTGYDYGSATADQRKFAHVTGNDGEYTSGTPTEGMRYA